MPRKRSEAAAKRDDPGAAALEAAERAGVVQKRRETPLEIVKSAQPSPINGPPPSMPPSYERITKRILNIDVEKEYERLERELELNEAATPAAVRKAANSAEANALKAYHLFVHATVAHERFKIDSDLVVSAMRDAATADLQHEKDAGQRTKMITEADVRGRAAVLFPDEWREANEKRVRAENLHKSIERLADLWRQRAHTLGALLKGKG